MATDTPDAQETVLEAATLEVILELLLETFVEWPRHAGTCYKAANWQWVGRTTGRGKKSTSHRHQLPVKDIWLYPLRRDFATLLRR